MTSAIHLWRFFGLLSVVTLANSCSSGASGAGGTEGVQGDSCTTASDCVSGVCQQASCVGNGTSAPSGSFCSSGDTCASHLCLQSRCTTGQALGAGVSCSTAGECASNSCVQGACAVPGTSGSQGTAELPGGAPFLGLGASYRPLTAGCGPDTANQCGGTCEKNGGDPNVKVLRAPALLCFEASEESKVSDPHPEDPAAIIEQVVEQLNGEDYVHVRVTFDPAFADNTYGENASAGWTAAASGKDGKAGKGHTFQDDLTGSDHVELMLTDGDGNTVVQLGEDYISAVGSGKTGAPAPAKAGAKPAPSGPGAGAPQDPAAASPSGVSATAESGGTCGFTNLGVLGGDGFMKLGSADDVLAATTSIYRNLNCGYCTSEACQGTDGTGDCTVNSPVTDASYTPNPLTPDWNYNVVYEVWIRLSAFGSAGFGQAYITNVHASPSKAEGNTLIVKPGPCPPDWPSCPPGSQGCWGGGTGGGRNPNPGGGGGGGECETNFQYSVTLEGVASCTPTPYANYPGMKPCPSGYALDTASEGRYCLPE